MGGWRSGGSRRSGLGGLGLYFAPLNQLTSFSFTLGSRYGILGRARGHTARDDKYRIAELHDGEVPEVAEVDDVAGDAESAEAEGKAVEKEEQVKGDDGVDGAG